MDEWQRRALQLLALVSAAAALPGGAVLIAYAVLNGFFPTLIETVSVSQLIFISVVVAFIVCAGLFGGMALTFWILWLTVRLQPEGRRRHIFMPPERGFRLGGVIVSACMFADLLYVCLTAKAGDRGDLLALLGYFCLSGLFVAWVLNAADGRAESLRRLLPRAAAIPLVLILALQWTVAPLLDLLMRTMGFRSGVTESVLVDTDAYERVQELVGPMPADGACAVLIGSRTFWHLRHAVVVWTGVGADTLISIGELGPSPLPLHPSQVMVLPAARVLAGAVLTDCEAPAIAGPHAAQEQTWPSSGR